MSTKPATLPTWNTGGANRSAPSGAQEIAGSATGDQLPSGWLNYWLYWIFSWLEYVRDAAFTSTTSYGASGETSAALFSGLYGKNSGAGPGLIAESTSGIGGVIGGATTGVLGVCSNDGPGVKGEGLATGQGVWGIGGASAAPGVEGQGGTGGHGVLGTGDGAGHGVKGKGVGAAAGVYGENTDTAGAKAGVLGTSLRASVAGVEGTNGVSGGIGGYFKATGGGAATGLVGDAGSGGNALALIPEAGGSPVYAAMRMGTQGGAPSTAAIGDMYVTSAGVLKICTNATGPVWTSVGAQT